MNRRAVSLFLFILSLLSTNPVHGEEQAGISLFSPQGTIKGVRQVTVRFSEQMVPFGDPHLPEPFDIRCPEKGRGRWADGTNWVYDFDRDIPAGVICEFILKQEISALSGRAIKGQRQFSFSTGGPAVQDSSPREGQQIDEDQIFILTLDAEASEESIAANVSCSIAGINERVGVRVLKGEEKERILRAEHYSRDRDIPRLVLQCKQHFPNNAKVSLMWGKGVMSLNGVQTTEHQVLTFETRSPFTATFRCERENPKSECIPLLPLQLRFSSPVPRDTASRIVLRGPSRLYRPERPSADDGEEESGAEADSDRAYVNHISFKGPFPENTSFTIELPKGVQDDAGRSLDNRDAFPLTVRTDSYPPLAKFSSRFGLIELKGDPTLPVTLRSLEPGVKAKLLKVDGGNGEVVEGLKGRLHKAGMDSEEKTIQWLRRVASAERKTSMFKDGEETKNFSIPKPGGSKAFEVVGIPLNKPGLYLIEIESRILGTSLLGEEKPLYVPAAALVTNLSAHFKWGRESSLVWVTTMDSAEPVNDVSVQVMDCRGKSLWKGKTDVNGIARIKASLPSEEELPRCAFNPNYSETSRALQGLGEGLFIFAKTAGDMTFVHSNWDDGIEPWRYNLPGASYQGPVIAHTIFDRTLLRAGETIHMKHLIRKRTMSGFSMPAKVELPKAMVIHHQGSDQRYEFALRWDAKGIAETEWKIPVDAKLGQYGVVLLKKAPEQGKSGTRAGGREEAVEDYDNPDGWQSGSFRVEEFRVPLMKALIQPPKETLVNAQEADIDLHVSFLSGGGARNAPVKLRSRIEPKYVHFDDYEDFTPGNGGIKEGITRRSTYGEAGEQEPGKPKLRTVELTLDETGSSRARIPDLPSVISPMDLFTELEFRDPNGEVQTVSQRIPLWPSKLIVGIRPDSWAASKEAFKFHAVALDISGKPVQNTEIRVDLFRRNYYSHRKRLVGGFYSYEHVTEIKRAGRLCEGRTDAKGLLICEVQSPVSGNVILQAEAVDDSGNRSLSHRDVWIAGKGEWWFDVSDNDRIDLLPEKKRYEPGETASFQVRMPFRKATALITVEREGVMETFVKRLAGKMPVVEIPVKNNYAPNVFVSVLVVRGRVSGTQPTAMVDIGKPAYKLGISGIQVGWKAHELNVTLSPGKTVYKVREKGRVNIKVTRQGGKPPPKGSEVALAAVDEGLLELMPNKSWKLLEAMMGKRGYEVKTSTAQMQVVGKRHYGLKALPQGGGGGRQMTRELFDTLLLWKARVPLDGNGEASVEIPLNDSLTSFRIVAVAHGGSGLFGTGQTDIRTTQDLMILPGIPPLVREGDTFTAGFTVRNASGRTMNLEVKAKVSSPGEKELAPVTESLSAGEAKEIGWEISVPDDIETLSYEVTAGERDGDARDSLRVRQKVAEAVPVRTFQSSITQIDGGFAMDIEKPGGALSHKGGINLSLRPRLSEGLGGVGRYMKRYPYTCMEQKVSRAVALRDEALWKSVVAELPSHLDPNGLVKYFPKMALGSDTLTAYVLSISHEAGWKIPDHLRAQMEEGLKGFIEGKVIRFSSLPTADLSIRKLTALESLSRTGKAEPRLLGSIAVEPNLWPTSAVIEWMNLLTRVRDIPDRDNRLKESEQILRSRLNFQGTATSFSTEKQDYLWWLMVSPDLNAVKSILVLLQFPQWDQDMPKLVKGALGRQHRGAWSTTTANAWGVLAIGKFSRKFEAVPVSGTTSAVLEEKTKALDWGKSADGKSVMFHWPGDGKRLAIAHKGGGKPWAAIQSLAAIPLKEPFSSGYGIRKTLIPVEQRRQGGWSRGDVIRVRLELEAQSDMAWVVVSDPIPAGSTILGTGLARDSQILARDEGMAGRVWPVFEERSFEAFRAYYEFVPKGKWTVEYTLRLNTGGTFLLPPTRVEAL